MQPRCFWQPLSACDMRLSGARLSTLSNKNMRRPADLQVRWRGSSAVQPPDMLTLNSAAMLFAMQPSAALAEHIRRVRAALRIRHPYIAIHVRHGDKRSEARLFPLSRYMDECSKFRRRYNVSTIFVMTDDERVIREAVSRYAAQGWAIHYAAMPRLNSDIKRSIRKGQIAASNVTLHTMADVHIAAHADFYVGTLSSNLGRLVLHMQHALYGRVGPYVSLDNHITFPKTKAPAFPVAEP